MSLACLLLAALVTAACYSDLKLGGEFELLLGAFVITACYVDVNKNCDLWMLLATFAICLDLKPGCIKIVICGCFWRSL